MRYLLLISALIIALTSYSTPVKKATIDLTIHPEAGTMQATTVLLVAPETGSSTIELLLNRGLTISGLSAGVPIKGFHHQKSGHGPYQYASLATVLSVTLASPASGQPLEITIELEGEVEPDDWGLTHVTPDYVEMEVLYCGWFPFAPGEGLFDLDLQVRLPQGWKLTGTGKPVLNDSIWVAKKNNAKDAVIIASPGMKSIPVGDDLTLWYIHLPGQVPGQIISDTKAIMKRLDEWFGPVSGSHLDLVFSPRKRGGGFARPGMVVMTYDSSFYANGEVSQGFYRYLAHEISHLWWHQAPAESWQDWLNESFAEFTALMILRDHFGEDLFKEKIEAYRKSAGGTPVLRGISRDHEDAFVVLYRKGPVILADLEADIGHASMMDFLHALTAQKVKNTDDCLAVLEEVVSGDARKQLEEALASY